MKIRHLCAVAGAAIAVGAVVFIESLAATNDHQSLSVAEKLLASVEVRPDAPVATFALDHRPGGRVMQGPPLRAVAAVDEKIEGDGVVVTKALFAARRLPVPEIGSELTLVGRRNAYKVRLAAVKDWDRPLNGYPNMFVSRELSSRIAEDWRPWQPRSAEELAPGFKSDAERNFDRAKVLLVWAAALTALCLLLNSLLLSIESRRREIAILRTVGMTRGGVVSMIAAESFALIAAGFVVGSLGALAALWVYVKCDAAAYPAGMAVSATSIVGSALAAPAVGAFAVVLALKKALSVRPLEAASNRMPTKRRLGMLISFACGFGAFVAVEVWGSSLMSAFIPSPEWPDAIVSILPGGVSSFDIEKLRGKVKGVEKIHELAPLQVDFLPREEMKRGGNGEPAKMRSRGGGRGGNYRNALLLGSDWLPDFRFVAGDRVQAEKAVRSGEGCIITEMMARARNLKLGDMMTVDAGGVPVGLKVSGIVDLNWHMVTSRGLVRGLNRKPVNTDGPVFVSFDTVEQCDARPAPMVKMTHLWLDYEPEFLARHGVFAAGREVEKSIVAALGDAAVGAGANTVRLHARDEIADGTLAHGVDIIGSMARVPFIFIAVVALGFVAMLTASAEQRRYEFRVLYAVGATRLQLAMKLAWEALATALLAIAAGFPLGALAGWLFTAATRAGMANWGLPANFAVPWAVIFEGAAGAVAFSLLVAIPASLAIVFNSRK